MKKVFLFVPLFLLTFLSLSSQTYRPIPSSGGVFKVENGATESGCAYSGAAFQYTDGDTLVDSLMMISIRVSPLAECYHTGFGCGPILDFGIQGFLWQDGTGRVYGKAPGEPLHLQFDFTLGVGDTITAPSIDYCNSFYTVDSTDTVIYADGIARKRLFLTNTCFFFTNNQSVWVEGIGDIQNGFLPYAGFEDYIIALCYREDSLFLTDGYPPFFCLGSACDELVGLLPSPAENPVSLSPNPGGSEFTLQGDLPYPVDAVLLDNKGAEVMRMEIHQPGSQVNTTMLPAGIYYLRILNRGEIVFAGRWVKM